ncbi:MAG: hypothetical protein HY302_00575 [Opitutae bacterium]|nr:hypothetical protein [Opitutae bacterium]
MAISSLASVPSPRRDPPALWRQIESDVRESCVLRCEGRNADAVVLLHEKLPPLIREWSAASGWPAGHCRDALRQLFAKAQEQVANAVLARRLVLSSLPAGLPQAGLQLSQRIPLTDINGMLDALGDAERSACARPRNFPPAETDPVTCLTAG